MKSEEFKIGTKWTLLEIIGVGLLILKIGDVSNVSWMVIFAFFIVDFLFKFSFLWFRRMKKHVIDGVKREL